MNGHCIGNTHWIGSAQRSIRVLLALALVLGSLPAVAGPASKGNRIDKKVLRGIKRAFARMALGVRQENELQFKSSWVPQGYENNLVGGRAGAAGRDFYRQYKNRRWLLKPKLEQLRVVPGGEGRAYVLPCLVWSPAGRRAIATIHGLLVYSKRWHKWQVLGGGGRRQDVEALGVRFVAGRHLPRGR